MKTKILGLLGLFAVLLVLSATATPIAHAANFTLTVHVDQKDKNGVIAPLQGAEISVQRCSHTSPNDEACSAWGDIIKYNTTASNGNAAFTVAQDYRWRIVATMDNRWCDVPTDCTRGLVRHDATAVTKTFQLWYPRYPGDGTVPSTEICPTLTRNVEVQQKVVEGGIYQSQVGTENKNFSAWYHDWGVLAPSAVNGNMFKIDPRDGYTATQVQQASANAPNRWWIIGEEPNYIQLTDDEHDGTLRNATTVTSGSFNISINKKQPPPQRQGPFSPGEFAVINNTASGGTDAFTRVVINSVVENTPTYWTYTVTYSAGASSGSYAIGTRWGSWPAQGQTPEEFAAYYHTMSQAILKGSSGAKIIMGYVGQYYPPYIARPWEYLDRVVNYWKTQTAWCAEMPMDAFHSNFFPFLDKDGNGVSAAENDNPSYTTSYLNLWRDDIFGGQWQAWLANERFSLGTSQNYTPGMYGLPSQEEANRYLQFTVGSYLDPKKYEWVLFQMNFSGYSDFAGAGNLLTQKCEAQPCDMTPYGKVFANAVYGNPGWETNDLSRWVNTCITDPPMFNTVTGGPTAPVKSQYALQFYTTTPYGCDLVSERYPLDASGGGNLLVELDYRIVQGSSDSAFWIEFYDANGENLGTTNDCEIISGVTNGWQHAACTFPLIAFTDATAMEFVIEAFPGGGSTKDFRFDNASVVLQP